MNLNLEFTEPLRWLPMGRHEPLPSRCYTWAAVVVGAVSVGLSAYEYASAPGPPKAPNLAQANRAGVNAQAATLPEQLAMESAAQQGTTYGKGRYSSVQVSKEDLEAALSQAKQALKKDGSDAVAMEQKQLTLQALKGLKSTDTATMYRDANGNFASKDVATANFTGYGEADVQGAVAKANAANDLALRQKYDPAFIAEALKERQLADPQGVAARAREQELLQQEISASPDRPVANLLDQQVEAQLKAGKGLDSIADSTLREAVAKAQTARGGAGPEAGAPDYSEPLTTGAAGQARLTAAQQEAANWLASGATPEDVAYRREQQNLADESAFINNATPQSQFKNLSGAQQGPTPMVQGQLSQNNPQAGPQTAQAAMTGWGTQLQQAENTANPWMAGLSALLKAGTAAGNAGYKPLAASP